MRLYDNRRLQRLCRLSASETYDRIAAEIDDRLNDRIRDFMGTNLSSEMIPAFGVHDAMLGLGDADVRGLNLVTELVS